ncbi:hypothetical protein XENOCAPTIV_006446 [Xenoophorus captivus]|uniref:Fringe-like glycosyltransferase domain-containing protein n=2 Tax=Goodeidae TaxID=28758 RepID=A0ABV0QUW6_9TELE
MRKRWIRRSLLVLIFTFLIIVFVDFQLSTSSFPKLNAAHRPLPSGLRGSILQVSSAAKDAQSSVHSINEIESKPNENNGEESVFAGAHATLPQLRLDDIYIAVKTTGRFHKTRLELLLDTWISRTKAHWCFSRSSCYNMEVTGCQTDHSQQALSCKMSAEYDGFMASDKR